MKILSLDALLKKLKSDKKLRLTVLLAAAAAVLLILSEFMGTGSDSEVKGDDDSAQLVEQYEQQLEKRVAQLVSLIDGAGETQVLITLECGTQQVYAKNSRDSVQNASENGEVEQQYESEGEYIIVDGGSGETGLPLRLIQPDVRGVAVVCEGAGSPQVERDVTQCVCAALGVSSARVSVTKMKTEGEK